MTNRKKKRSKVGNFFAFLASILLIFAMISTVSTLLDYESITDGSSESPKVDEIKPVIPDVEVPDPLQTPYGRIPEEYADPETFPILLFSGNEVVWAGDRFGGESTYGGVLYQIYTNYKKSDTVVYFQKDHTDVTDPDGKLNTFYNFGLITGNHVIDLNGNTFTAATQVLNAQAKNKNDIAEVSWTIKNGSIDLNSREFLRFGSVSNNNEDYSMKSSYLIENVKFFNITTGKLVADNNRNSDYYILTSEVVFRNCVFDIQQTNRTELFYLGTTDTSTYSIDIKVEGGTINYVGTDLPLLFRNGGYTNKTFSLGRYNGEFPVLKLAKNDTIVFDVPFDTELGQLYFVAGYNDENYTYYYLGEKNE